MRQSWKLGAMGLMAVVGCHDEPNASPPWPWPYEFDDADSGVADAAATAPDDLWQWPRPSEEDAAVPEPFTREFTSVVSQPVRWASVDVTITGARLVRGLDADVAYSKYDPFSVHKLDPREVYAEIDLSIAEQGSDETDYRDRNTWDLRLQNGTRLRPVDTLGVSILPGDTVTTQLHYAVPEDASLNGASLILEGESHGYREPEEIPLDAKKPAEFPQRISTLVGKKLTAVFDGDEATVEIDEAVYDVNLARISRAKRDDRYVWMRVAVTATDDDYGAYCNLGDLRIIRDGRATQPVEYDNGVIERGVTEVWFVAFEIAEDTSSFELMVPDGTARGQRLTVNLARDAKYAGDVP